MATTIDDSFLEFAARLYNPHSEPPAFKQQLDSIQSALDKHLAVLSIFKGGSWNCGTHLNGLSPLDYFVAVNKPPTNSEILLRIIASALRLEFPEIDIVIESPKVVMHLGETKATQVHVIPVKYLTVNAEGHSVYGMAGGDGKWL